MFYDRSEAGAQLAHKLKQYLGKENIVFAASPSALPIAASIADRLSIRADLLLVKTINDPHNPGMAVGAASADDYFLLPGLKLPEDFLLSELRHIEVALEKIQTRFPAVNGKFDCRDKTVVIVDDAIISPHAVHAIAHLLRKQHPKSVIIAAPVASDYAAAALRRETHHVITIVEADRPLPLSSYFLHFHPVSDPEISHYLLRFRNFDLQAAAELPKSIGAKA